MFKKFALYTSSGLLKLSLLGLALAGAGWLTFGTPEKLKQAAEESNVYGGIVDGILESAAQEAQNSTDRQLPINDPKIQQIAKDSFSPETLSAQSESIIDGIYAWLQGKTTTPQFSVDLTNAKQQFASGTADYAAERYEALPACTFTQMRSMYMSTVDPFTAACRPPQIPGSQVRERVYGEITNSDTFMQDASFTANDLPKDGQGKTIIDNLAAAPAMYNLLRLLPWVFAVAAVVLVGLIFLLHDVKKSALRSIGITFLGTGIFIALGTILLTWSFDQLNPPAGTQTFQTSLLAFIRLLVSEYNGALIRFYLAYLGVGTVLLLTVWRQNRTIPDTSPR